MHIPGLDAVGSAESAQLARDHGVEKGAYAAMKRECPEIVFVGLGSDVSFCVDAVNELSGTEVRLASMPSWDLLSGAAGELQRALLPKRASRRR